MRGILLHNRKERGGALVEFAVCSLVLMPLFLGIAAIGSALIREIQVTQVCRDSGHMYANGVDFSLSNNPIQTILTQIGGSLRIGPSETKSAVILTTITYITQSNCTAANLQGTACTNVNHYVITKQIQIGGVGNIVSKFGSPPASDFADSLGNVKQSAYLTDSGDQTSCPFDASDSNSQTTITNFKQGNLFAYSSEVTVIDNTLDWAGFIGSKTAAASLF